MTCGCDSGSNIFSFGRTNPKAAEAMHLMRSKGISLKKAWKIVNKKSSRRSPRRSSRRSPRRSYRKKRSFKVKKSKRSSRHKRRHRRRHRRSRNFGASDVSGPGFYVEGTPKSGLYPYFGKTPPAPHPPSWWAPEFGGKQQIQANVIKMN
jgi:hypothetical protein